MESKYKILFDGECNLCNTSVRFIKKRDKKKIFGYTPIQQVNDFEIPEKAIQMAKQLNTILLIEEGKVYTQSTAMLRVCRHLGGVYSLLYIFIIIPRFIRDSVYKYIARNRYKWFGKKEVCDVP